MSLVRDLLQLPASISKGDFVQSLTTGIADSERTVETYAVTPELVTSFDHALKLVGKALATRTSVPVYLDGSFGSGKSHFMAVLDLMLAGHAAPWRNTQLHPLRAKHPFVDTARLLQIPVHMLGPETFEAKVFGAYVARVEQLHPGSDLPQLFADAPVFDNAEQLRRSVGDDAFFARLNEGAGAAAPSFFGAAAATVAAWDRARYDEARASLDPAVRSKLFTRLCATWLPAYTEAADAWVRAAVGWNEIARHAASLGYDGVVLYLDEMILWLMGMISDPARMSTEFEKLVQIVEGQDTRRPIPLVAFVARQRRPENLVDATLVGTERSTVFASMAHHEGRFDRVELRDSTLRAIIPHRVARPRSEEARARLAAAFDQAWARAEAARPWLAAGTATEQDFRQVYPFSPALVDVLIALSDQLQRERTAVRILVELLVEHASDLELGQVVPVGDVFDLVAGGEDAFDRAAQSAFQRARNLYLEKILPLLQQLHGVEERCQRRRPGHPIRIGCSGCPERLCRTDNRLVKTALLAALAPDARPLAQLTVKRLVHLNHGVFGTAEEDLQIDVATARLRKIAADVDQIRLEGDGDPTVRVSLESVETGPILEKAERADTRPRRRQLLRQLLWEELGLKGDADAVPFTVEYHCVKRQGTIRFGNVRTLPDADLRCPPGSEWQVVIDYPFDEPGYSPAEDEQRLHRLRGTLGAAAAHTLVWLPTFFSERAERDLGDLCKLEHLLSPGNLGPAITHIPPDDHERARGDLEALRHRKETDLRAALAAAYGLRKDAATEHLLDDARRPSEHLVALDDGLEPRNPRELTAGKAISQLAEQILEHRYPNHPLFQDRLTPQKAARLVELLERVYEADGTVDLSRDEEPLLRDLAAPLGLCRVFSLKAEKLTRTIDKLEQQRAQHGEAEPTVAQLRAWADPDGTRGFSSAGPTPGVPELAADLIGWVWAANDKRLLTDGGKDVPWPANGKLPPGAQYVSPKLPSAADFAEAIARAGAIFGITPPGRTLKAKNVAGFARMLGEQAATPAAAAWRATPDALAGRWRQFALSGARGDGSTAAALRGSSIGGDPQADGPQGPAGRASAGRHSGGGPAPRLRTAEVGAAVVDAASTAGAAERIAALARVDLAGTSLTALERARRDAVAVLDALKGHAWGTLELLQAVPSGDPRARRAEELLGRLAAALAADELNVPLARELREISTAAVELLKGRGDDPAPNADDWQIVWEARETVAGADVPARLDAVSAELLRALQAAPPGARLVLNLALQAPKKGSS